MPNILDGKPDESVLYAGNFEKFIQFAYKNTNKCLACNKPVDKLEKVDKDVYARPCGCILWRGAIPAAWRD